MSDISKRLKEERIRGKLSQEEFGRRCGVSKRTVFDWEAGKTSPTLLQISALAEDGVDPIYVLTGIRQQQVKEEACSGGAQQGATGEGISNEERVLLENFRSLSEEDKRAIRRQSDVFAELNRMKAEQKDKKAG